MADDPRNPRHRARPDDPPRPVTPPRPPVPRNPDDLEDLKLAPGDPFIQAAYQRVGKTTAQLGGGLGAALRDADGTDALMIHKLAKRSRVMSFQVQGIVWKAGFCKELQQAPLGAALRISELPIHDIQENGAIVRPVPASLELIFRELLPSALLDASDKMYGLTRVLMGVCLYFIPRDAGAVAGIVAQYGDSPTSRSHTMYLQTALRRADARVLDQILLTFEAALPRAQEATVAHARTDFWQELERNLYQVRATYRTSALHEGSEKVKSQLATGLKKTGNGVEKAFSAVDQVGERMEWALNLPVHGLISMMQGLSNALVWTIQALDRLMRRG